MTRAVDGPPEIWVQSRPTGRGPERGVAEAPASFRQAAAGCDTVPVDRSEHSERQDPRCGGRIGAEVDPQSDRPGARPPRRTTAAT